jgi:hypothetical protein
MRDAHLATAGFLTSKPPKLSCNQQKFKTIYYSLQLPQRQLLAFTDHAVLPGAVSSILLSFLKVLLSPSPLYVYIYIYIYLFSLPLLFMPLLKGKNQEGQMKRKPKTITCLKA